MFFASQILETVTQDTARLIMTGQAQNAAYTQAQFKDAVCAKLTVMFDCENGVSIDVQSYTAFSAVDDHRPDRRGEEFRSAEQLSAPAAPATSSSCGCSIKWPLFVTGLGFNIANMGGNKRLLTATAAFQNEPLLHGDGQGQ